WLIRDISTALLPPLMTPSRAAKMMTPLERRMRKLISFIPRLLPSGYPKASRRVARLDQQVLHLVVVDPFEGLEHRVQVVQPGLREDGLLDLRGELPHGRRREDLSQRHVHMKL